MARLHGILGDSKTNAVLIVAQLAGVNVEFRTFDESMHLSEEFRDISPLLRLPILEINGLVATSMYSAIKYLAKDSNLFPEGSEQRAEADNWLGLAISELAPSVKTWTDPIFGRAANNANATKAATQTVKDFLNLMKPALKDQPFLGGCDISAADVVIASILVPAFRTVIDGNQQKSFNEVTEWMGRMGENSAFNSFWGKIHACKKAQAPTKAEIPETWIPPTLICETEEEEEEEGIPDEFPSDSFDSLPTKFNLATWKRAYDRAKDKTAALEKFWDSFDDGWSVYKIRYVPAEDESTTYLSQSNKMGAFIYKIETLRDKSFGTIGLYGDSQVDVQGLFVWRGNGVPAEMFNNPSFAQYAKTKLDADKAKQLAAQYWVNLGENQTVEGKIVREVKLWK